MRDNYAGCYGGGVMGGTALAPLVLTSENLPTGMVAIAYNALLTAAGGQSPYTFAAEDDDLPLPSGLALDADTGAITGAPTAAGEPIADYLSSTFSVTTTNVAPAILAPAADDGRAAAWLETPVVHEWSVADVTADVTNGLRVSFAANSGNTATFRDCASGVATNYFAGFGDKTLTMTVRFKVVADGANAVVETDDVTNNVAYGAVATLAKRLTLAVASGEVAENSSYGLLFTLAVAAAGYEGAAAPTVSSSGGRKSASALRDSPRVIWKFPGRTARPTCSSAARTARSR